jgi:hypothetical protein
VTELASLDGPAAAAVSEQLVAVYRAAMGAAPFFETEVEAGTERAWPITHDQDTPTRRDRAPNRDGSRRWAGCSRLSTAPPPQPAASAGRLPDRA